MATKVAINGLGRIGRSVLKLVMDEPALELVTVKDLINTDNLAYLLRFASQSLVDRPPASARVADAPRPRTSSRPRLARRWRRRARCPNMRTGSTGSRYGRPSQSGRSPT